VFVSGGRCSFTSIPVSRFCCSLSFVVAAALAAHPRAAASVLFVAFRFMCEMQISRYFFVFEMHSFLHSGLAAFSTPSSQCQCNNFPSRSFLSAIVVGSVNFSVINSRLAASSAPSSSTASMSA
jgi:hypothetical protein